MEDTEFKTKVCEDLGYIKAKVETLEKAYVPCQRESVLKVIKANRTMIFSIYSVLGVLFTGIIIKVIIF